MQSSLSRSSLAECQLLCCLFQTMAEILEVIQPPDSHLNGFRGLGLGVFSQVLQISLEFLLLGAPLLFFFLCFFISPFPHFLLIAIMFITASSRLVSAELTIQIQALLPSSSL